jgi:hypothetical protein
MKIKYEPTFSEANFKSPLNYSTAKMRYSFPKAERFNNKYGQYSSKQFLYNIPDSFKKQGTSLGYGEKTDFTKVQEYKKAAFTDTRNNLSARKAFSPSYSFGVSRSSFEKVVKNKYY